MMRKLVQSLKQEMKKKKSKSKIIKQLLDDTMDERRRWIKTDYPTAEDIVAVYPPLRLQRWVRNLNHILNVAPPFLDPSFSTNLLPHYITNPSHPYTSYPFLYH